MFANRIGQLTVLLRRTTDAMRPTSRARRPTRRFSVCSGIEGLEERLVLNGTLPTTTAPAVQTNKVLVYSVTSPTSSGTVPGYAATSPKNPPTSTGTSGSTILLATK
jgi:hypothetical protein